MNRSTLKVLLKNAGWICAILGSIILVIVMLILVIGVNNAEKDLWEDVILPSIINGVYGLMMSIFFYLQGRIDCKEDNKSLIDEYYGRDTKDKRLHSDFFLWFTRFTEWTVTRALPIAGSIIFTLYIAIQGSQDWAMLVMSIGSILMTFGLGMFTVNNGYEDYAHNKLPKMRKALEERGK